jgi:(p)ppGpp synthase/HD superfamily hydrolase
MARDDLPTAVLTARFADAVRWASVLHADQSRKGTQIAYVSHLLAVASLVLEDGGTEEEAIAGLLHDAIEDCHVSEAEIRARYGGPVAEIVVACSEERPPGATWDQRKRDYLTHLGDPALSAGALRVTSADKLHNARAILSDLHRNGSSVWDRFNAGVSDQAWYYTEMARVLTARAPDSRLTQELQRVVDQLVAQIERIAQIEAGELAG